MRIPRTLTATATLSALLLPSLAQAQGEGVMRVTCVYNGELFAKGNILVDGKVLGQCPKADIFLSPGGHKVEVVFQVKDGGDIKSYEWKDSVAVNTNNPARVMAVLKAVYSDAYLKKQAETQRAAEESSGLENFKKEITVTLSGHKDDVRSTEFSQSAEETLTSSFDGTVNIYNTLTGTLKNSFSIGKRIMSARFSANNASFCVAGFDGYLALWDKSNNSSPKRVFSGHTGVVNSCDISQDGRYVISSSSDSGINLWDATSGEILNNISIPGRDIRYVRYFDDSRRIVFSGQQGTIGTMSLDNFGRYDLIGNQSDWVWKALPVKKGEEFIIASHDGSVRVWSASSASYKLSLNVNGGDVTDVGVSTDGIIMATSSQDGKLRIWRLKDGDLMKTIPAHSGYIISMDFSDDGTMIATSSDDNSVKIWPIGLLMANNTEDIWNILKSHPRRVWVSQFIKHFPSSPHIAEAKKILEGYK